MDDCFGLKDPLATIPTLPYSSVRGSGEAPLGPVFRALITFPTSKRCVCLLIWLVLMLANT